MASPTLSHATRTLARLSVVMACSGLAMAQTTPPSNPTAPAPAPSPTAATAAPTAPGAIRTTGHPQRDTLVRMMRPVSISLKDTSLEAAFRFVTDVTGADIEIMWADDRNATGLDKEQTISLEFQRGSALTLVERILEKAGDSTGSGSSTWQLSESGSLQVGPRSRLNQWKRVVLYPINDLLLELPRFGNAPELDLQNVLQQSGQGGGGGGQSPFNDQDEETDPRRPLADRAAEIVDLLQQLVEPEQWVDNGGDGGSMRFFQGSLIVNAPDYMHRQLNGYPYWPKSATRVASTKGRRYVSLGMDSSLAKLVGFDQVPVTAVTGSGELVRSNPPGGQALPAGPK
jgi:hypothetical protein